MYAWSRDILQQSIKREENIHPHLTTAIFYFSIEKQIFAFIIVNDLLMKKSHRNYIFGTYKNLSIPFD